jgi:hypothetical protein
VLQDGSNDCAGVITFGTGSSPGAGAALVVVKFGQPWTIAGGGLPHVVICPYNQVSAALGLYVEIGLLNVNGFSVAAVTAPAAGADATAYAFSYIVIG